MFFCKAMHKVDLGTYSPLSPRRGAFDLLDDVFGRAVEVGGFYDFAAAFWVYHYFDAWIFGTRLGDLLHAEAHVRCAVAFPEYNAGTLYLLIGVIRGHGIFGIPYKHLCFWYAVLEGGIAAQVFVGEEEYALAMAERPFNHGRSVRRGANDATIAPTKGFEVGGRVHVGDGNNSGVIAQCIKEHLPAFLHFGDVRHVGHRAASGGIGQDDLLVRRAKDICALSHKMHAAKDDVIGLGTRGCQLGEFE